MLKQKMTHCFHLPHSIFQGFSDHLYLFCKTKAKPSDNSTKLSGAKTSLTTVNYLAQILSREVCLFL